jgi:hypothetical protein
MSLFGFGHRSSLDGARGRQLLPPLRELSSPGTYQALHDWYVQLARHAAPTLPLEMRDLLALPHMLLTRYVALCLMCEGLESPD